MNREEKHISSNEIKNPLELEGWRQVSKRDFFSIAASGDVHPTIVGNFPYTHIFKTKTRMVTGKIVDFIPEGKALYESRYYLPIDRLDNCIDSCGL